MGTIRSIKSDARNNKEINAFLSDVTGRIMVASERAMNTIAERGLQNLVNNVAGFSDFTGVLINSYQAAIITRGGWKNKNGRVTILSSYGMSGTTPISRAREPEGYYIRKRRNPMSKQPIRGTNYERGRFPTQGYGRDYSNAKAYYSDIEYGIEVVFSNPTPYANTVQFDYAGSTVMPMGVASQILPYGTAFSITQAEIFRAARKAKRNR